MYFYVHKQFLDPDHVAMQAAEAERKLQASHYGNERKDLNWNKYVTAYKEQHDIKESITDYGYSGSDNDTKAHQFLWGFKSTELKRAVKVIWA